MKQGVENFVRKFELFEVGTYGKRERERERTEGKTETMRKSETEDLGKYRDDKREDR